MNARPQKSARARLPANGRRRLYAFSAVGLSLAIVAVVVVRVLQPPARPVPEVPLANLETNAVAMVQEHIAAVRTAPGSGQAWGKLGGVLRSLGFNQQARECLVEAATLDATDPRWPYLLATIYSENGREGAEAGIDYLRQAVALCGNEPETPRLRLAQRLAESGRDGEARAELEQLLRAKPGCAPARILLAQITSAATQRTGESMKPVTEMAAMCTTNPHTARAAWTLLTTVHRRNGDTNAAEAASRRASVLPPDPPWPDPYEDEVLTWRNDERSLGDRAQAYLLAGRTEEALPLVRRLAERHPHSARSWLLLGRAQILRNQPGSAEKSLREHLRLEPDSVSGHFQLGMSLFAQARHAEAIPSFERAIALKRDFGPAFFNLGFALARSGRPREAIPAFEEAIRLSPEMTDAYILLADLHLQSGNRAEAAALADLAARLNPEDRRLPTLRQKIGNP